MIRFLFLAAAAAVFPFDTNAFKRACAQNDTAAVKQYLSNGASPNLIWEFNGTPIMTAAGNGANDTLALLIARGATNFSVRETWRNMGETALEKAAKKGHTAAAKTLLKHCDVNSATSTGMTALMFAARNNDTVLIDALIRAKAAVNRTNAAGVSALLFAVERGNYAAAARLLAAKADARISLPGGLNALRLALVQNDSALARLIAERSGGARSIPLFETYQFAVHTSDIGTHAATNGYAYRITTNADGRIVIRLASPRITVESVPSLGNRVMSFRVDGHELLAVESNRALSYDGGGIPILYPTPNAVADASFMFDGRKILMDHPFAPYPVAMHGIVKDAVWQYEKPILTALSAEVTAHYTLDEKNPRFSAFPYIHRISVTYTVTSNVLGITFAVKNSDTKRFGFGFGLHPYWRVIGSNTSIQADIPTMLKGMTGPAIEAAEGLKNISRARAVNEIKLNDMYYPRTPASRVSVLFGALGIAVDHYASAEFTHLIAWTPGGPYFALEDQTCSADAHNQYAAGARDTAHLIIIAPGEVSTGTVRYEIRRLQ